MRRFLFSRGACCAYRLNMRVGNLDLPRQLVDLFSHIECEMFAAVALGLSKSLNPTPLSHKRAVSVHARVVL